MRTKLKKKLRRFGECGVYCILSAAATGEAFGAVVFPAAGGGRGAGGVGSTSGNVSTRARTCQF